MSLTSTASATSAKPDTGSITNTWMSAEGAALTLGKSLRTVHRWITSGKLESRLEPDGRRSVLVSQLAPGVTSAADTLQTEIGSQNAGPGRHPAGDEAWQTQDGGHVADATGAIANAVGVADTMTVQEFRTALSMMIGSHTADARRERSAARLGWLSAITCAIALAVTMSVTSAWHARDQVELTDTQRELAGARGTAARMSRDRDQAFVELGKALEQADAVTAASQIAAGETAGRAIAQDIKPMMPECLASVFDGDR